MSKAINLPTLPEVAERVSAAVETIDKAERKMQRATLADRVWIGVCCLAARERHALPPSDRGQGRKITSPRRSDSAKQLESPSPQGFLQWISEHVTSCAQPTVYKYMRAAEGAGLTAWSSEEETRKQVARLLRDDRSASVKSLGMKAPEDEDEDEQEDSDSGTPPAPVQLTFDDLLDYRSAVADIRDKLENIPPKTHKALTQDTLSLLEELTDQKWKPVSD